MRRFLATVLSAVMLFSVCACDSIEDYQVGSGTASRVDGSGGGVIVNDDDEMFEYVIYSDHSEIVKYVGNDANVTIPEALGGKPVTVIGEEAFLDRATLISVYIPETVHTIGKGAFKRCYYLETVTGCDGIAYIGDNAFAYDRRMKIFPWTESLQAVGMYAFTWCESLEKINIVASCNIIGDYAFRNCTRVKELIFEDSQVEAIGKEAFMCLYSIESLNYPYATDFIGEGAFKHAQSLKEITYDPRVSTIANRAFQNSQGLTEITIPKNITAIEDFAFGSCHNIKKAYVENPYLVFGTYIFLQMNDITIIGAKGSTAEYYANKSGVAFEELEPEQE